MNPRIEASSIGDTPVYRATISMAFISGLQRLAPAIVSSIALLTLCLVYGVEFDQPMGILAALSAALSVLMIRPGHDYGLGFGSPRIALAISVFHRWVLMLGLLLLAAYMAKFSAVYSRRVVLTWAAASPVGITLVMLWLQGLMDRAMADSTNRSSVLFVGVNDGSLTLSARMRRNARLNMRVAGFFDDRSSERLGGADRPGPTGEPVRVLGRLHDARWTTCTSRIAST